MFTEIFLPILTFGTLFAVVIFALKSQNETIARMNDDSVRKSSLSTDGSGPDPVRELDKTHDPDGRRGD